MFSLDTETFYPANTKDKGIGKQVRRTDYPHNHHAARSVRKSQCEKAVARELHLRTCPKSWAARAKIHL